MRAAIIFNPARIRVERLEAIVADRERAEGWEPSLWIPTSIDGNASELVDAAADARADVVIAAGGDGTVSDVGAAVVGRGIPFGVVASGTANLFARNLGLPVVDTAEAVRVAFVGTPAPVDAVRLDYRLENGETGERRYLVSAGFGIDADMVAGSDDQLKRRIGWFAYVGPVVWALRPRRGALVEVAADGGLPTKQRLHSIFLGNCELVTGGIRLLPDALMDDGLLNVLALRDVASWVRRRALPGFAVDAPGGTHRNKFRYTTATTVELRFDRSVPFQADGDPIGPVVWARATVERHALSVLT